MLKLYDKNKKALGYITQYKDLKIEHDLSNADKTLSFSMMSKLNIEEEYYIETKTDRYVVKEKNISSNTFLSIVAALDLEELEEPVTSFIMEDVTLEQAATEALKNTGWTVQVDSVLKEKKRNTGLKNRTVLTILKRLKSAFFCELEFDTLNRIVKFKEKIGIDRGVHFFKGLNLKSVKCSSDTYEYYTRIIPIGKDGLQIDKVNDGKKYLENYQYSNKIKTYIWEDDSYTDATALKEDAEKKLNDLSKPKKSFQASLTDLAKRKGYEHLKYSIGDTIVLIDPEAGIKEKQRVVKITEYPHSSSKDTCELSNTVLNFEEQQKQLEDAADILEDITTSDGGIKGDTVDKIIIDQIVDFQEGVLGSTDEKFQEVSNGFITIGNTIQSLQGEVSKIDVTFLKITEAEKIYATNEKINVIEKTVTNLSVGVEGITQTVSKIETDVNDISKKLGDAESKIEQNAENIELSVKKADVNGDYIIGKINLDSTTAAIEAKYIKLEGIVTANDKFKINLDGSMTALGGTFEGDVKATNITAQDCYRIYNNQTDIKVIAATKTAWLAKNYELSVGILKNDAAVPEGTYITFADIDISGIKTSMINFHTSNGIFEGSLRVESDLDIFGKTWTKDSIIFSNAKGIRGIDSSGSADYSIFYFDKEVCVGNKAFVTKLKGTSIQTESTIISGENILINNNNAYYCKSKSGINREVVKIDTEDTCLLGSPSHITAIRGTSVRLNTAAGTVVTSDRRLKTDIQTIDSKMLEFLFTISPVQFHIKGHKGPLRYGYIAQEVEEALEKVGLKKEDFAGIEMQNGKYGLIYEQFIALHTLAVQTLNEKIKSLEKEIKEMKL